MTQSRERSHARCSLWLAFPAGMRSCLFFDDLARVESRKDIRPSRYPNTRSTEERAEKILALERRSLAPGYSLVSGATVTSNCDIFVGRTTSDDQSRDQVYNRSQVNWAEHWWCSVAFSSTISLVSRVWWLWRMRHEAPLRVTVLT